MNWPSHTDYQDSIQNPHICFEDEELIKGEVGCDMLGLPRVMSGNFACVYSMKTEQGKFAIRCFVRQVLGQQGRYARLSQHLLGLGLPFMVDFEYILRGIKVRTEFYPIVKMAWVDGLPLNQWFEEEYKNSDLVRRMVPKLTTVMKLLREHNLAHGDLQHGNIMVTGDHEIKLVDYDGMYTPAFQGRSPEMGHANFQHPRRTPEFYNESLDNFAGLVLATSFLAIAEDPSLWDKFFAGDNLLFVSNDFRNPSQSECFKALKASQDEKVKSMATLLEKCCLTDISKVPDYADVIEALEKGDLSSVMPDSAAAPTTAAGAGASWLSESPVTIGSRPAGSQASPPLEGISGSLQPKEFQGTRPSPPPTPIQGTRPSPASTPGSRPAPPSYANAPKKPSTTRPGSRPSPGAPAPAPTSSNAGSGGGKSDTQKLILIFGVAGVVLFLLIFLLGKVIKGG